MIDLWLRNQGFVFDGRWWYAEFKGNAVRLDQWWIEELLGYPGATPESVLRTLKGNLAVWKETHGL